MPTQPAEPSDAQFEAQIIATGLAYCEQRFMSDYEHEDAEGFADWFCDAILPTGLAYPRQVNGMQAHEILRKYSAESIATLIESAMPPLFARLVPQPEKKEKLINFLQAFLAFNPEGEPEEPDAPEAPQRRTR